MAMAEGAAIFNVPGLPEPCHTWYRTTGEVLQTNQTPLVVLHGGPGACHDYLLQLTDLSLPLVLYDQIRTGKSTHLPDKKGDEAFWSVDLCKDKLDNLGHLGFDSRPADVYGHSLGSM